MVMAGFSCTHPLLHMRVFFFFFLRFLIFEKKQKKNNTDRLTFRRLVRYFPFLATGWWSILLLCAVLSVARQPVCNPHPTLPIRLTSHRIHTIYYVCMYVHVCKLLCGRSSAPAYHHLYSPLHPYPVHTYICISAHLH